MECVLVSDFDYEDIDTLTKSKNLFYLLISSNHIYEILLFEKVNYGAYSANGKCITSPSSILASEISYLSTDYCLLGSTIQLLNEDYPCRDTSF